MVRVRLVVVRNWVQVRISSGMIQLAGSRLWGEPDIEAQPPKS